MSLPSHTIVREKGMGKEYSEGLMEGCNVMNFIPAWPNFMNKFWDTGCSKKDFEIGCRLLGDNRKNLRELLGKPSFHFSSEFYFHCWYVRLPHTDFIIMTAKGNGTCYEVVTSRGGIRIKEDIQEVLGFLGELIEVLPQKLNIDTMQPI